MLFRSYTYIPFDPLPVLNGKGISCDCIEECEKCEEIPFQPILQSLPDQTVRLSVAKIDASGSVNFGSYLTADSKYQNYRVVLDYVNVDVTHRDFYLRRDVVPSTNDSDKERYTFRIKPIISKNLGDGGYDEGFVSVPVYVGVGLRLTAEVTSLEANANLSGLSAIAAEVAAGRLKGSLTVQSLGITGKSISAALPLPSEINETTIQNALVAIGSIKGQIYDGNDAVIISPRVVGIYKPFKGGIEVINGIISELSRQPVEWKRPCKKAPLYGHYDDSNKESDKPSETTSSSKE